MYGAGPRISRSQHLTCGVSPSRFKRALAHRRSAMRIITVIYMHPTDWRIRMTTRAAESRLEGGEAAVQLSSAQFETSVVSSLLGACAPRLISITRYSNGVV
eukprot:1180421-Prorocentrum_minimum.AAC.2